MSEESAGGLVNNGTQVSGEKELRVEHKSKVSDMWTPSDDGMLEPEWGRGSRTFMC